MISICMIVKNEEKVLEKCLLSIKKYNYEIVIVDTGSTDRTKEIAIKYTDKIYDYEWNNNFSDARNYSISKASNDYILVLDADEEVENLDKVIVEQSISEKVIGRVLRKNNYKRNNEEFIYKERVNRLFSKKYFRYDGSIHEQIISKENKRYNTINIPIVINHIGYESDEINRKNKTARNILLLKEELKIKGDDPYILFQLGKSYYMDSNFKEACEYFNKALEFDLDTKLEFVIDMVESYGYALINDKRFEDSMMLLGVYDEFSNSADFVFLIGMIYMNNGLFNEAINEFKKALKFNDCKMEGVNSYLAYYNIGVINECLGNISDAIIHYNKCKEYDKAKSRLESITKGRM